MKNKLDIFEHYKGQEELIRRLEDWVSMYERRGRGVCSEFLSLSDQEAVNRYLGNLYEYHWTPSFENSMRKCLVLGDCEEDVVLLKCEYHNSFVKITHPDILGALMNLGLEREQYGDLWMDEDTIYIYVKKNIQGYVEANLTQIHKAKVHFEPLDYYLEPLVELEEKQVIVSSLRADAFVSEIAHVSRAKAQQMIRQGLVNLNFRVLVECDVLCHNGDILSIRHHGRFKVGETKATTKRDNKIIKVYRYV